MSKLDQTVSVWFIVCSFIREQLAMGWNAALILISQAGLGYFADFPKHHYDKAPEAVSALYQGLKFTPRAASNLLDELKPDAGRFALGVYDAGLIISDPQEIPGSSENPDRVLLNRCLALYPNAHILVIEVSSIVSYFGYRLYEKGRLIRAISCEGALDIPVDDCVMLDEEVAYLKANRLMSQDSAITRFSDLNLSIERIATHGEALAFNVAARYLGVPLDGYLSENLTVGTFQKHRRFGFLDYPSLK